MPGKTNSKAEKPSVQQLLKDLADERKKFASLQKELTALKESQDNTKHYEQEFLLNMSHEFVSSLNSILILSNILSENKESNLDKKQVDYAQIINDSATDLLSVIKDVQDLARIMSGNISPNLEELSIVRLASYLRNTFESVCAEKNLNLVISVGDSIPEKVMSDRFCLEKILKSLISNAIKFTNRGKVQVTFEYSKKAERLTICVEDTGVGIAKDKKQEIFKAFRAYAEDVKHSLTGAGLGLSISTALAGLLQGKIKLHSQKGKGSTFTLTVPSKIASVPVDIESVDSMVDQESGQTGVNKIRDDRLDLDPEDLTMLVVEDDPNFANILFEASREQGFRCLIAEDGEAALHLANEYRPTAIVLDIGLPRLNGIEVLRRLKKNSRTNNIPVCIISGFDKRFEAISEGAFSFLFKPITMDKLSDTIQCIKSVIQNGNRKIVFSNFNGNDSHFALKYVKENALDHVFMDESFDMKELFHNHLGRCIIVDTAPGIEPLHRLLNTLKEDSGMGNIPIIITSDIPGHNLNLESFSDDLVLLQAASESELNNLLNRYYPQHMLMNKHRPEFIALDFDDDTLYKDKTVVIADNNERDMFAFHSIMDEKGVNVVTFVSGEETIDYFEAAREADMLLVNMSLPDMNGLETIKNLRNIGSSEQLPVIALSGKGMKGDRQKCIRAGANDYLSKPIAPEKLIAMLQVWLNTH